MIITDNNVLIAMAESNRIKMMDMADDLSDRIIELHIEIAHFINEFTAAKEFYEAHGLDFENDFFSDYAGYPESFAKIMQTMREERL